MGGDLLRESAEEGVGLAEEEEGDKVRVEDRLDEVDDLGIRRCQYWHGVEEKLDSHLLREEASPRQPAREPRRDLWGASST